MAQLLKWADFPFSIKQHREVWCIPATIQAVTKYCTGKDVDQKWIWERWVEACCANKMDPLDISFPSIKESVLDKQEEFTSWTRPEVIHFSKMSTFQAFLDRVERSLNDDTPPIISTPVFQNGSLVSWHVLCVGAYYNNALEVHDPNPFIPVLRRYPTEQLHSDLKRATHDDTTDLLILHRL